MFFGDFASKFLNGVFRLDVISTRFNSVCEILPHPLYQVAGLGYVL